MTVFSNGDGTDSLFREVKDGAGKLTRRSKNEYRPVNMKRRIFRSYLPEWLEIHRRIYGIDNSRNSANEGGAGS
jgi:hypothetical protein